MCRLMSFITASPALITGVLAAAVLTSAALAAPAADGKVTITDKSFRCMTQLTPVRGFFVGNLLGDEQGTLKVARSKTGGVYPAGSVVQLVPTEVMVKQPVGFNAVTRDWEFFELDVSRSGSVIRKRGFADVVNQFGGNCFGCHVKAHPEWDMICETTHGCDPVPFTPAMLKALQDTDPRCAGSETVSAADAAALKALADLRKHPPPK
jgi:hypothetical protein